VANPKNIAAIRANNPPFFKENFLDCIFTIIAPEKISRAPASCFIPRPSLSIKVEARIVNNALVEKIIVYFDASVYFRDLKIKIFANPYKNVIRTRLSMRGFRFGRDISPSKKPIALTKIPVKSWKNIE